MEPRARAKKGIDTMTETEPCSEEGCERVAAVRLHIPWAENRDVCTAHARVLVRQDGIVAEPLEGAEWE